MDRCYSQACARRLNQCLVNLFVVTPKEHERLRRWDALKANKGELLFGVAVLIIAFVFNHTIASTIIIAIPGLFSIYLSLMANNE